MMGVGTFVALGQLWLSRFSPRLAVSLFFSSLLYYQMATSFLPVGLGPTLFGMGRSFGFMFPALATLLTQTVHQNQHGSAFGMLSAVLSSGMIVSSLASGTIRDTISPY